MIPLFGFFRRASGTTTNLFKPVIHSFTINDTYKNRVNFSSLEPLTSGSTYGGFTISNKSILSVHYFILKLY